MIKSKIIPFPSKSKFTLEAEKRWHQIDKSLQKKILENIWCSTCSATSAMILESARMEQDDLILRGKCKVCKQEVCRVVEADK